MISERKRPLLDATASFLAYLTILSYGFSSVSILLVLFHFNLADFLRIDFLLNSNNEIGKLLLAFVA